MVYTNIPLALGSVEHDDSLPTPNPRNNGTCMKKNQQAPLQKTNMDLHVPKWILISPNSLYLILYRSLYLMI